MLLKRTTRCILVGLVLFAASASSFAWHRVRIQHRHHVMHPRSHMATFTYIRPVVARNWGEVDFNVEPQDSLVYVDGVLLGKADDLNGWPSTAHLKAGRHNVRIVSPAGKEFQTRIYVQPSKELNFDYRFK